MPYQSAQRPGYQPLPRGETQLGLAHSARSHRAEGLRKRLARRLAALAAPAAPAALAALVAEEVGVAVEPARDESRRRRRRLESGWMDTSKGFGFGFGFGSGRGLGLGLGPGLGIGVR